MRDNMGFSRRNIAALLGTHTLGAMDFENSGFSAHLRETIGLTDSAWVGPQASGPFGGNDGFDNRYYFAMVAVPWDRKVTQVDGVDVIEWLECESVQTETSATKTLCRKEKKQRSENKNLQCIQQQQDFEKCFL